MGLNAVKVLGISITTNSKKEVLEYIQKYLQSEPRIQNSMTKKTVQPLIIVTPNPEQIVLAQRDTYFADILNRADIAIPDGIGVVWASKLLKQNRQSVVKERMPGVELVEDIAKMAAREGVTIGLIGGRNKVAVKALECLQKKYPSLVGKTTEKPEVLPGARIIFVGLGAPKQEYFIKELKTQNSMTRKPLVFMAVGGSFDIIAGRLRRAPLLIRLMGFEWAWRLINEPWRWRRQMALLEFILLVIRQKFFDVIS